ncbi:hypothetical protein Efla_003842 [Eimeria flavescens]
MSLGPIESLYGTCLPSNGGGGEWSGEGWASIVDAMLRGGGGALDMGGGGAPHLRGAPGWPSLAGQAQATPALSASLQQQQMQQQMQQQLHHRQLEQQQQSLQQQQHMQQQLQQHLQRYSRPPLQQESEHEELMPFNLDGHGADGDNGEEPASSCCSSPRLLGCHKTGKRHSASRQGVRGKRRRRLRPESDSEDSDWRPEKEARGTETVPRPHLPSAPAAGAAANRHRFKQQRQQRLQLQQQQQQHQQESDDSAVSVGSLCLSSLAHTLKPHQQQQHPQQHPQQQQRFQQQQEDCHQQQPHYTEQHQQQLAPLGFSLSPFNSSGLHVPSASSAAAAAAAASSVAAGAEARLENAALNDYDMCEVSVEWHLPELPETADRQRGLVPVRRVFGINAGMTLFNLHRIICISLGLDEDRMCSLNHVWILPNNTTYGGGPLTKSRSSAGGGPGGPPSSNRLKVTTDRAAEYRHSICCYLDEDERIIPRPESVLIYVLGCVQMQVQILSVLRNKTKQNALIWVPRCVAAGSYGTAPGLEVNWNSPDEVSRHLPALEIDVKTINLGFIETRFSKNTSISRRTKMIRADGMDSCVLQCYSESIHEFWKDTSRVRQLAIRVSRQSVQGKRSIEEGPSRIKQLLMHRHHQQQPHHQQHHQQIMPFHQASQQQLELQQHKQQHALQQQQQLLLQETHAADDEAQSNGAAAAATNNDPQKMMLVPYGGPECHLSTDFEALGGGPPEAPDDAAEGPDFLPLQPAYGVAAAAATTALPWELDNPSLLQGTLQQQLLQHEQLQQQQGTGLGSLLMQSDGYFLLQQQQQQQQQQFAPFLQLDGFSPEAASLFLQQQLLQHGQQQQQQQQFPLLEGTDFAAPLDGFAVQANPNLAAAAAAAAAAGDSSTGLSAPLELEALTGAHHGMRGSPGGGPSQGPSKNECLLRTETQPTHIEDLSCSSNSFCYMQENEKEDELLLQQFQATGTATPALLRALQQLQLQPWAAAAAAGGSAAEQLYLHADELPVHPPGAGASEQQRG